MYKHILIATDGSELAEKAVAAGLMLAEKLKAKVTAITVTEPWTALAAGEIGLAFPYQEYEKGAAEHAARILATVSYAAAKGRGLDCATVHIPGRYAAEGIARNRRSSSVVRTLPSGSVRSAMSLAPSERAP